MEEKIVETNLSFNEKETSEIVVKSVKHQKDRNYVELTGTVIYNHVMKSGSLITVLTSTGKERNVTSSVTVFVPNSVMETAGNINKGQCVHVTGCIRTRIKEEREMIRTYEPYVSADSLVPAKSEMEEAFGLEGGRVYEASFNRVVITGDVYKVTQVNRALVKIVLRIRSDDNRFHYVEANLFARNMKKLIPQVLVGNRICLIGELQSSKKGTEEKPVYFRNIVILDLKEV